MSKFIPMMLLALLIACLEPASGQTVTYPPQTIGTPVPGHCIQWGQPIQGESPTAVDSGGPCGGNLCLNIDSEQAAYWAVCSTVGLSGITTASLPVCNSSSNGARKIVTDSMPISVAHQALVSGGSTWVYVECSGSNNTWVVI